VNIPKMYVTIFFIYLCLTLRLTRRGNHPCNFKPAFNPGQVSSRLLGLLKLVF
jgi:hypothetical protein